MAENPTIGFLDTYPILGSSPARWALREGIRPVQETFDFVPEDARKLEEKGLEGKPVKLYLLSGDGPATTVDNLWVLRVEPGETPYIKRVTVADRRWFWPRGIVTSRYNIRRNVGFKRIKNIAEQTLQDVVPEVWYARWSLENPKGSPPGSKWTAKTMLKDVMKKISSIEEKFWGQKPTVVVSQEIENTEKALSVENLEIDDSGDQAAARALSYLPEAGIYVDLYGNVIIYSRTTGKERAMIEKAGPPIIGAGVVEYVNNKLMSPKEIHVYFTREVELRLDFNEPASKSSTVAELGDSRRCENVLPVPDFEITINGKSVPQGTWVTFEQYMNAIGAAPSVVKMDHDILQKAFVPYLDLWAALELTGTRDPNIDWTARVAAMQQHYRKTFRINPRFMDRILSIRAYRISTVDVTSGTRAPAEAYSDYCVLGSQRSFFKTLGAGQSLEYAVNIDGYPDGAFNSSSKPSPARVSILDSDQGIIHLDYLIDAFRLYDIILPSKLELSDGSSFRGPTGDIKQADKFPISFDSVINANQLPRLSSGHDVAFLLTAVPAAPNSKDQLHKIVITPKDVSDIVPGAGNSSGPIWEVRVGAGVETARIAWNDARSSDIEAIFGIPDPPPGTDPPKINLENLVLNEDPGKNGSNTSGASLNTIAKAVAARIWASLATRFQGNMAGMMNPALHPDGWLSEVEFEIDSRGVGTSKLNLPDTVPQLNLISFLDSSTRAIILREVQAGR